ncbi:FxsB family cyclophane-forming radical SAM/SPASM peptide maturase [Micromonospora sp. HUAS LYJ1]|uniref:FxsB family cyclophane-forming radical SAM/SPASM peptide maturase n=1 Tax=Micromonospora sp. HUAS LYJ1 TaxID=3061626 RepID=UPI00267140D5|nr:FxsB family cyclophane-forming radical SAM/SPASM peptide maturase [Micromonospora sp. HUAS LYJ1]WKU06456.1 FxsB family cyclophane-forming radical SAM/SPASM peptide maturase [Micromonospora sp. HUAS LYJ1]
MSPPSARTSDPATAPRSPVTPLSQYVLKLASRCDLACDHCYVYEHPDQSWRRQPRLMTPDTVEATARRIAEHAATHRLSTVRVVLHGGEPLLAGAARLATTATTLRLTIDPVTRLDLRMQTNGVLLTPEIADVLVAHDVKVGVSLDGDRSANDRHRRYANGASSHDQVRRALALLRRPAYRSSYAGLLCTVDLANDPLRVYLALLAEEPPRIDFLLPHANWDRPPARPDGAATPYADWLLTIHRRWLADGRPVPIRLLESLLATATGGSTGTEAVGLAPADLVVVETDGSFEQVDSLKSAFHGAAATGLDVFRHAVDEAAAHPGIAVRQSGLAGLCATCRSCPLVRRCGGGLVAHRYRSGTGFDNPSAYCADLAALIRATAVPGGPPEQRPADTLPPAVLADLGSGRGGPGSVGQLAAVHHGIARALTVALSPAATADPVAAAGWHLLVELDVSAPDAVDHVLTHPFVRRWAQRCRAGANGDLPHLAAVAAAVAVRAGVDADLVLPVRAGAVHLPTLGAIMVDTDAATVPVTISAGGVALRAGRRRVLVRPAVGPHPDRWRPTRAAHTDDGTVLLEDTDPYRDCFDLPVAARLTPAVADRWTRQVRRAVDRLDTEAAGYAAGVRALLRAVVPLRPDPSGRARSAAARSAFGAVAVTPVADDAALAVLLVHEVQHLKLDAVLDVCELFDPADARRLRVPWRDDPRPVEGALHGVYAHLAVADVWRHRPGVEAAAHHRRYREWTDGTVDALLDLGSLTADGERFVSRMRATLDGWR